MYPLPTPPASSICTHALTALVARDEPTVLLSATTPAVHGGLPRPLKDTDIPPPTAVFSLLHWIISTSPQTHCYFSQL